MLIGIQSASWKEIDNVTFINIVITYKVITNKVTSTVSKLVLQMNATIQSVYY